MFKKFILFLPIVLFFGFTASQEEESDYDDIYDACNSIEAKKKCKQALSPDYEYDASKSTKFTLRTKKQFKELEVPLYIGERYRFVFNTEGMPQPVDIEVYDKMYEAKNRTLLFSSREKAKGKTQYIFEPEKSKRVYIDYNVPPTNDTIKKGCVVFALGYKLK